MFWEPQARPWKALDLRFKWLSVVSPSPFILSSCKPFFEKAAPYYSVSLAFEAIGIAKVSAETQSTYLETLSDKSKMSFNSTDPLRPLATSRSRTLVGRRRGPAGHWWGGGGERLLPCCAAGTRSRLTLCGSTGRWFPSGPVSFLTHFLAPERSLAASQFSF